VNSARRQVTIGSGAYTSCCGTQAHWSLLSPRAYKLEQFAVAYAIGLVRLFAGARIVKRG